MMSTIKELVEQKSEHSDLRIRKADWSVGRWGRPRNPTQDHWDVFTNDGQHLLEPANQDDWKLYEEPKSKVKRARYLIVPKEGVPYQSAGYFVDDNELQNDSNWMLPDTEFAMIRLTETERDFDK